MQHQSSKSGTTITARVFDPAPPRRIAEGLGALVVLGFAGAVVISPPIGLASIAGIVLALLWDTRMRRGARLRRIVCKPGSLRIRGSGLIRATDLEGATTARFAGGISLVLSHRRRRRAPIIIELPDDAALMTVCKGLGIGHHGFGHVDFVAEPPRMARVRYVPNVLTLLACATVWIEGLILPSILTLFLAGMASGIVALARLSVLPKIIRLTSAGVFVPGTLRFDFLPFLAIEDVTLEHDAIVFRIESTNGPQVRRIPIAPAAWSPQGASRKELEHFVVQISAAAARAHGKGLLKSSPEMLAEQLMRSENESIADWHARLDLLGVGSGYRATTVEPGDLWALFEDPDATAEVRAAAGRVLRRIDPEEIRVRVADVLATVRDDATRARIAASIGEVDAEEEEEAFVHSAHS